MKPSTFLAHFYEWCPTGLVDLRCFPNGRGYPRQQLTRDQNVIDQAAQAWANPNADHGVYFGVALRSLEAKRGTKDDVHAIPALWVDIDTEKEGWDKKRTIGAVKTHPLRPSIIIDSGRGLHLYWLLSEPVVLPDAETHTEDREQAIETVEQDLRDLSRVFGGDNATCEIARVMRLPGTYNTKDGKARDVKLIACEWDREFDIAALNNAVNEQTQALHDGAMLTKQQLKEARKEAKSNDQTGQQTRTAIRTTLGLQDRKMGFKEIWRHTKIGGGNGSDAIIGLDEAILRSTAVLYVRFGGEWTDDLIVNSILQEIKKIKKRDAPKENWNWNAERKEIHDKLNRFKIRWSEEQQ